MPPPGVEYSDAEERPARVELVVGRCRAERDRRAVRIRGLVVALLDHGVVAHRDAERQRAAAGPHLDLRLPVNQEVDVRLSCVVQRPRVRVLDAGLADLELARRGVGHRHRVDARLDRDRAVLARDVDVLRVLADARASEILVHLNLGADRQVAPDLALGRVAGDDLERIQLQRFIVSDRRSRRRSRTACRRGRSCPARGPCRSSAGRAASC